MVATHILAYSVFCAQFSCQSRRNSYVCYDCTRNSPARVQWLIPLNYLEALVFWSFGVLVSWLWVGFVWVWVGLWVGLGWVGMGRSVGRPIRPKALHNPLNPNPSFRSKATQTFDRKRC